MLRDIPAPGALGAWVSKDSQADPQGWQKNLLNRVIDACRAVPDASVPADLLIDEPIITSSLELVMQSVTNLLAEAIEKLKSMDQAAQEFAAKGLASEAAHSAALASASKGLKVQISNTSSPRKMSQRARLVCRAPRAPRLGECSLVSAREKDGRSPPSCAAQMERRDS